MPKTMTNKEWIRRVLQHDGQVPVPYNLPLSPLARRRLEEHYGTGDVEGYLNLPIRMTGPQSIKPLYASPREFGSRVRDEFGVEWTTSEIDRGSPVGPCLTEPDLAGYTFPDPTAAYRFEHLKRWCDENANHYTVLWAGDLWERATFMCGMERLLLYVATEPKFVHQLLASIADYILRTINVLFDRFTFDCIALSDDYGTQRAMLISPAAWRRFVKPRLAEIFAAAKRAGKAVFLHSCGNVRAVVPDLVEMGLDVLHPIQPEALDVLELKAAFGRDLTFCGGLGTQDILVHAGPDEIREEVRWLQQQLGRGGGYVLEPGITLQADVPLENILAMIDAARG
ncbi:MAG: uroporphyrinogen decarboxylase family protein [Planctomycetota bacterium]